NRGEKQPAIRCDACGRAVEARATGEFAHAMLTRSYAGFAVPFHAIAGPEFVADAPAGEGTNVVWAADFGLRARDRAVRDHRRDWLRHLRQREGRQRRRWKTRKAADPVDAEHR